jgi:hypothetical protein
MRSPWANERLARRSCAGAETNGFSQPGLPVVEGPETIGFQFEGAGDMERVERADAESRSEAPGEIDAGFPGGNGKCDVLPDSGGAIALEAAPCPLSLRHRKAPYERLAVDCIRNFAAAERRQAYLRLLGHAAHNSRGVRIDDIRRDLKAGIGVNDQYRLFSLSAMRSATGVRTRSPKCSLRRAAKSGHSTGFDRGVSGMMRPTTRLRLRISTTSPASSQAKSCRESRS